MNNTYEDKSEIINQNKSDGPTIDDLKLLLKRIEKLDLKLEEATDSKQAA